MTLIDQINTMKLYDQKAKYPGVGNKAGGATVAVVERGDSDGVVHQTVLTLA